MRSRTSKSNLIELHVKLPIFAGLSLIFKSLVETVHVILLKVYFNDIKIINRKWGQNRLTFLLLVHLFMLTSIVTVPRQISMK